MPTEKADIPEGWIDTRKELPPKWTVLETINMEGIRQPLMLCPPLWFD